MSMFTAAPNSVVLGDLFALQQYIRETEVGPDRFYFKLEEGSFQRPAFFIKLVESTVMVHHQYYRKVVSQVMVQYFTEDYYDAQIVANDLQMVLSGGPVFADVVLPRYDFTTFPPTKCSVSGWNYDDRYYEGNPTMGARIDPNTINMGGIIQEENRGWNVPITFSMTSPLPTYQDFPIIEDVIFEILTGKPLLPQIGTVCVRGLPSVEISVE